MAGRNAYSYRDRKGKPRSGVYLVLAVLLVIVMFKWGIPSFVNLMAGPSTTTSKQNQTEDNIPPQNPILSALPNATNSANIRVEGFTEGEVTVTLVNNDNEIASIQSGKSGDFSFNTTLKSGENKILVKAKDRAGNESSSGVASVIYDNKSVEVKIDSPKDGQEFFGTKSQTITITGKVSKQRTDMTLNNSFVRANSDGTFSTNFKLSEGDNTLTFVATDDAGNTGQTSLKLKLTL